MLALSSRARKGPGLKLASLLILLIGLSIAAGIYFFAPEEDENMAMSEIAGSKQYNRSLQQFGGKAAVIFDELQRWFGSLWHGKRLGATIACVAVAVAGVLLLVARILRQ